MDTIQDRYLEAIYRLRNYRRQDNEQEEELTEEQLRELYGGADAGDIPEELLRQFAEEDNNDDDADEDEDEDEDEEEGEEVQEEQMRARAGFAPEPFPGDVVPGEEGAAAGEEGEDVEDDGGVGSSQGATAHRIKKVGKKKAEKLQRKEQMRAYHEFMEMQRTERRQQEEMFRIHEAAAQEERQRKRTAQIEKDRQRKEQLKEKEAKENDSRRKRIQAERVNEETARRELRSYIQNERRKAFPAADTNCLFYFLYSMNTESEIVQVGSIGQTARQDGSPAVERPVRNCTGEQQRFGYPHHSCQQPFCHTFIALCFNSNTVVFVICFKGKTTPSDLVRLGLRPVCDSGQGQARGVCCSRSVQGQNGQERIEHCQ
ncbi:MAG: hypothetical protein JOS17DRAFT_779754 [Linnemannia elongata]|nr:MAG: hypothetical protein JOS17DRAFT_779754 [Linnemannia elongata]